MRATVFFAALAFAPFVVAQYISEGWKPGQPLTRDVPPAAHTPGARPDGGNIPAKKEQRSLGSFFDLSRLLETGAVSSLLGKAGINVTESLKEARAKASPWDERIPLINDDTWGDLVLNEPLTAEEEEKGLWFLIITATGGGPSGGMSKVLDEQFDEAYNITQEQGDLPFVKWGRLDYYNVTYLTTKWNIWQAPYLMVSRDRGQTLYFYKANNIKLGTQILRDFLLEETWRTSVKWDSPFAPGQQYEFVMHYIALGMRKVYDILIVVPRWIMMLMSGAVASLFMRVLHRNPEAGATPENDDKKKETKSEITPATTNPTAATTATPSKSKGSTKSKKSGKK